tara:strand:+ start:398 stop:598 length:201 start_codon:yes stop_codon:yes gene_type:complete
MNRALKVGDLIKLRGMTKEGTPIGIIEEIRDDRWGHHAVIRWTNPEIASRWALVRTVPTERIERVV